MSSAFSIPHDAGLRDDGHLYASSSVSVPDGQNLPSTSLPANSHLLLFSTPKLAGVSPPGPTTSGHTPAESIASLSVQQSVTDYQEQLQYLDLHPFVGADPGSNSAFPTFLQDHELVPGFGSGASNTVTTTTSTNSIHPTQCQNKYPLSPETTPQIGTTSPLTQEQASLQGFFRVSHDTANPAVVAPQDLFAKRSSFSSQLTPDVSGSGHSSEDDMTHKSSSGLPVSPRVAVSYWDENNVPRPVKPEADADSPTTPCESGMEAFPPLDDTVANIVIRPPRQKKRRGLGSEESPSEEVAVSVDQLAERRKVEEKNEEVREWIEHSSPTSPEDPQFVTPTVETEPSNVSNEEIPLGNKTENQPKQGQTYFCKGNGGQVSDEDMLLLQANRNWGNAPQTPSITKDGTACYQPQTSQQAIEKYQRMNDDVGSTISRAATWGTRPVSIAGMSQQKGEDVLSGNILKRLNIKGTPHFIHNMRRPNVSNILKRTKTDECERSNGENGRTLSAPRSTSRKKETPSIADAIITIGQAGSSIGAANAGHGRNTSSGSATSATSPNSPLGGLGAKFRNRSKSDISTTPGENTKYPHLVTMWRQQGGPPIAVLGTTAGLDPKEPEHSRPSNDAHATAPVCPRLPNSALEEDDDDDEDDFDDSDMKMDNEVADSIEPTLTGFQKQVLRLNPMLAEQNSYLVDRIAYRQLERYKGLLGNKVKHLSHISKGECPTKGLCVALGGSAIVLDSKGGPRCPDALSAGILGPDGDVTPLERTISQDNFPKDIPMPPTSTLPAEFECQLCFTCKVFKKPSDWTKHVHEDVQPFTCTWDRCREAKMFKRKADWVRHENEGHRHLEWWKCDVEDCHHTCYRRDNFLQHLVREHRFPEPMLKTKAAIKKFGTNDQTWRKVEECHHETVARPQDEPCRFCGKTFPTWKKLTVHLAKHMEQISLPILKLVKAKDLDADTIISPIQDPPPLKPLPPPPPPPPPPATVPPGQHPGAVPTKTQSMPPGQGYQAPPYTSSITTPKYSQAQYFSSFSSINPQAASVNQLDMTGPGVQQSDTMSQGTAQQAMSQAANQFSGVQVQPSRSSYRAGHNEGFVDTTTAAGLEGYAAMAGTAVSSMSGQGMPSTSIGGHAITGQMMNNGQGMGGQELSGLGLQAPSGAHLGTGCEYDANAELHHHFSSPHSHPCSVHGSMSPYGHSPHQGNGGFYS